ncbi:MAG: hypothetical protein Q9204_009319 [Flavoplaca sp. TL-2023a]
MSYLCALLSTTLQHTEPVVSFTFFCGLHVAEMDPIRGPTGIVRSLVRRLLDVYYFDLDFIDLGFEEQLRQHNMGALLDLFSSLFKQLPEDLVLFCVIDGVSFYESAGQIDDLETVIGFLVDLTKRRDTGPRLQATAHKSPDTSMRDTIMLTTVDSSRRRKYSTTPPGSTILVATEFKRWLRDRKKATKKAITIKGISALRKIEIADIF